jgi:UDP-N-acetylglucosamine transferase subunit ALG13
VARIAEIFSKGTVCWKITLIFLTVGTWHKGYDRLVKAVDGLIISGIIAEEVIAQTGYSSYEPKQMTVMKFCSPDEFVNIISKASIVISHAGIGTIIEAVKHGKTVIAVPRKSVLGEVDNEHQFITAKQLEKEGKILVAYEVDELSDKLKDARTFVPSQGHGSKEIIRAVQEFIGDVITKKKVTQ